MAVNFYDQGCRYLARQEPMGFYRWVMPRLSPTMRFALWLDTRNVPFPGAADRTGDTVGCLDDPEEPAPPWAVPLEFQREPDPEMFGRFLEFLGAIWRTQRPSAERGDRYQLAAAVVNLTGAGQASRDFVLGRTGARTCLIVAECNVASHDAAATLEEIAAGDIARCVLAFIPLMQRGGEAGIIARWQEVALAEPDARRRGDYGGLAVVFAELTDHVAAWKSALKEWNMEQSPQVLEWQAQGEKRGELRGELRSHRTLLRQLLEKRFGALPKELLARIDGTEDLARLRAAVLEVLTISSVEDLQL